MKRQVLGMLILLSMLAACDTSRVFEKNEPVPVLGWGYDDSRSFSVKIDDTLQAYNLYINVRHTTDYSYNNLWVKLQTTLPDSSMLEDDIELTLSEPTGEWTGNCLDGTCLNSVLVRSNVHFPSAGMHTFTLTQDMRVSPLRHIMDVGIRLEKISL